MNIGKNESVENLIVIATNNGKKYLTKLLKSLEDINSTYPIAVIDTISTDKESIDYLEELKKNNPFKLNIQVHQTPYSGYDSGAYLFAMNNINANIYYLFQDSLIIKNPNIFNDINNKLEKNDVISLIYFEANKNDSQHDNDFCIKNIGTNKYSQGIFGPMFSIKSENFKKIDKNIIPIPTNKDEQMSMERVWSIIFDKYNLKIDSLEGIYDLNKIFNDGYFYINKILVQRK